MAGTSPYCAISLICTKSSRIVRTSARVRAFPRKSLPRPTAPFPSHSFLLQRHVLGPLQRYRRLRLIQRSLGLCPRERTGPLDSLDRIRHHPNEAREVPSIPLRLDHGRSEQEARRVTLPPAIRAGGHCVSNSIRLKGKNGRAEIIAAMRLLCDPRRGTLRAGGR
jgi:hypothetical protein